MARDQEELTASLIQLAGHAPWRRALFTTYTLSLSFFEAYLLPRLEDVGCSDILILVDESHYLESLGERQSYGAGRAYRVVPVKMNSGGVFHPKVAYFWGEQEDICAIGSGNLTYAGQGGNLECLEILTATRDKAAFADVSSFFWSLLRADHVAIGSQDERVLQFQNRAEQMARGAPPNASLRVLHSVEQPILAQLVNHVRPLGPWKRLTVMAPFHHPNGKPICELAQQIGATELDIALDPADDSAPLRQSDLRTAGVRARFVVPQAEDHRSLHAKWFEFRGVHNFQFTGSVNATSASLEETTNVEVAVLREVGSAQLLEWAARKPKSVRRPDHTRLVGAFEGTVSASLSSDDRLRGTIHGIDTPAGSWKARALARHREWDLGAADVDADGRFEQNVGQASEELLNLDDAVHLRLRRKGVTVAGWIAFEIELDSPPQARGAKRALDRLSRGHALEGDIWEIVHWVCSLVNSAGPIQAPYVGPKGQKPVEIESTRVVTYDEWLRPGSMARSTHGDIAGLFRRTLAVLAKGKDELIRIARDSGGLRDAQPVDDEDPRSAYAPIEEYDAIAEIVQALDDVLEARPDLPMAAEFLRARAMLTVRPHLARADFAVAATIGLEWLRRLGHLRLPTACRASLFGLSWAMAGIVQSHAPDGRAEAYAAELRQLLDSLFADLPPVDPVAPALEAAAGEVLSVISDQTRQRIVPAICVIRTATTLRQELQTFLNAVSRREAVVAGPALSQAIPATTLKRLASRSRWKSVATPALRGCPTCYCSLSIGDQHELAVRRVIVCRQCSMPLVWLGA